MAAAPGKLLLWLVVGHRPLCQPPILLEFPLLLSKELRNRTKTVWGVANASQLRWF